MPEIVSPLPKGAICKTPLCSFPSAQEMYRFAAAHVAEHRLKEYIDATKNMQQKAERPGAVYEYQFLEEYCWCVYVSGFSAKVISDKFRFILMAHKIKDYFGYIKCVPETMLSDADMEHVYTIFKNKAKAKAVQEVRRMIAKDGWTGFHCQYVYKLDPKIFEQLPNLGPALSCHLARNLGNINICKPDVHLRRIADKYGFDSVQKMCETLNPTVPAGFVDLLLWLACIDHGTQDRT